MAGKRTGGEGLSLDVSDAGYWFIHYWLAIMTPLLGAFNSAVYFYPRYTTHRKQHPDKSRMACLFEVLRIDTIRCYCERPGTKAASDTTSTASTPLISEEDIQALPWAQLSRWDILITLQKQVSVIRYVKKYVLFLDTLCPGPRAIAVSPLISPISTTNHLWIAAASAAAGY